MQSEKSWRQIIFGFAAILVSGILILGSLSFSLLENKPAIALLPQLTDTLQQVPAINITVFPGDPTFTLTSITWTPTLPPPVSCPPPMGWGSYDVQPDDTLASLADLLGYSVETIADGNCLLPSSSIQKGMILYLPYPASPTSLLGTATATAKSIAAQSSRKTVNTPFQCGRPAGWTTYVVRYGDTLSKIALQYYTTVGQLQRANCLTSTVIRTGRILYVPNRATRTLIPTATLRPSFTPTIIVPTTQIPVTVVPTTVVPSIPPATTIAPTTPIPTTSIPTTVPPTSPAPTTSAPTTPPTTVAPTSPPPTTVPPTSIPTTVAPTQPPPTTAPPPPTTAAPTTEPPPTTDP